MVGWLAVGWVGGGRFVSGWVRPCMWEVKLSFPLVQQQYFTFAAV